MRLIRLIINKVVILLSRFRKYKSPKATKPPEAAEPRDWHEIDYAAVEARAQQHLADNPDPNFKFTGAKTGRWTGRKPNQTPEVQSLDIKIYRPEQESVLHRPPEQTAQQQRDVSR